MSHEETTLTAGPDDCVKSIADRYGFFWETIWNHPSNAELKSLRKDPNVLMEGDKVFVPALRQKEESRPTEATHTFRRKGVPSVARFRLMRHGKPRAGVHYTLEVEGKLITGRTTDNGVIETPIPPGAKKGRLKLDDNGKVEEYDVKLGGLDPVESPTGLRHRLTSLGYRPKDESPKALAEALRAFQSSKDLETTGQVDAATKAALVKAHGC